MNQCEGSDHQYFLFLLAKNVFFLTKLNKEKKERNAEREVDWMRHGLRMKCGKRFEESELK